MAEIGIYLVATRACQAVQHEIVKSANWVHVNERLNAVRSEIKDTRCNVCHKKIYIYVRNLGGGGDRLCVSCEHKELEILFDPTDIAAIRNK